VIEELYVVAAVGAIGTEAKYPSVTSPVTSAQAAGSAEGSSRQIAVSQPVPAVPIIVAVSTVRPAITVSYDPPLSIWSIFAAFKIAVVSVNRTASLESPNLVAGSSATNATTEIIPIMAITIKISSNVKPFFCSIYSHETNNVMLYRQYNKGNSTFIYFSKLENSFVTVIV